ncbi:radical SAM protein [Ruminococcus albus]|uniref:radical SAM protein n=1 Tax=Ruminococcus albus TaxID=1264 RepID=UPI000463E387|nr:radical SAM protein [Ruminococcus albus]
MLNKAKVEFSEYTKIFSKNSKSLVANIRTGNCLFLSDEIVNIYKHAEAENMIFEQLYVCVEDSNSRELIVKISERLDALKMWKHNEKELLTLRKSKVSLDITNKCNLRCRHCCMSAGDELRGKELSTDGIFTIIDRMMLFDPDDVTVSGGEPMFREDFFEITEKIRSVYDGSLSIMTNGTLIKDDETAKYLTEKYDNFNLSLDGYDEISCEAIRGKGVFDKVINAVKYLRKYTNRISLSMIRTSDNMDNTTQFRELCKSLDVFPVIRAFEPVGRGRELYDQVKVDRENDTSCINWNRVEDNFVSNKLYNYQPQIFACQGAVTEFQIDQKGDVFPCPMFMDDEYKLFNILDIEDPEEFISSRKYLTSEGYYNFSRYLPENVPHCSNCEKQLMCFSCAAEIKKMMVSGDIERRCAEYSNYFDLYWRDYERV